jgi:hypothetical protein
MTLANSVKNLCAPLAPLINLKTIGYCFLIHDKNCGFLTGLYYTILWAMKKLQMC